MSRTIPTGGSAQIQRRCSSDWIRVQVENDVGVMVTHAPYSVEYEDPSADRPIGPITLTFRRGEGINSLAPLMTANPPIDVGRLMTLAIDAGDGSWTEVFRGYADRVAWPKKEGGDVTVEGRDLAGRVMDTFIEEDRAYGSEAGDPLEDVIQAVGDDNLEDPLTVHVAAPTGAVVVSPPDYVPSDVATFEAMQHLAESIGYAIRMRYIDGTGWALSLFEPERAKTVPDRTFDGALYYDVSRMEQDNADVFNAIEVEYSDENGVRQRILVEDAASIARYGRRYMRINEASDSIIRDPTKATALGNAALSDLAWPKATMEIQCAYFWAGEVGIDLYRFEANGVHFSSDQDLAAVAIKHRLALGERPESWITVRGKPSAGVLLWEKKARQPKVSEPTSIYQIRNLNVQHNSDGTSTVTWELGARLSETFGAYQIVGAPETPAKWEAVRAAVLPVTSPLTITTPVESGGTAQLGLLRLEGRYTDAATGDRLTGDAYEHTVFPKTSIPAIDDDTGELAPGAISAAAQFAAGIVPVGVVDALPADDSEYTIVVLTTDRKLYRWDDVAGAWTAAVPAVDLTGQITETQIADDSISTPKLQALAVEANNIAAGAVTAGKIDADAVTAAEIAAGAISAEHLAVIELTVGQYVESDNYVAGTSGWHIDGDGDAEFANVDIYGGLLQKDASNFLDLNATGTDPVLQVGGLSILANGDTLVADVVQKTRRISHHGFRPFSDTTTYTAALNNTTSLDASSEFACPLPIPPGAEITAIRFRGAEGDLANDCDATLYRQTDGGTNTAIQSVSITTAAAETRTENVSPAEVVDETYTYIVYVEMNRVSGTAPSFQWFEVDYTSHSTRETL